MARELSTVRGVISEVQSYSGFISVGEHSQAERHLFFWLVPREKGNSRVSHQSLTGYNPALPSDPERAAVVLYLQGAGLTIGQAVFKQTGPFLLQIKKPAGGRRRRVHLIRNRDSWHKEANILYIDFLPNTGFSFSSSPGPGKATVETVTEDLVSFLSQVVELLPHYLPGYLQSRNKLLIWAQALSAPLAVSLAAAITSSELQEPLRFNLQGLALENPLINLSEQLGDYFSG